MLIILYESPSNYILSFSDKLRAKFPRSSIGYVGVRDKVADVSARFQRTPFFTAGWLIECQPGVKAKALSKVLENPNNTVVIRVTSAKMRDEAFAEMKPFNPKLIDNYVVKEDERVAWIKETLECSDSVAKAVDERTGGKIDQMIEAVSTLGLLGTVRVSDVAKYVKREKKASVSDLFQYMLGVQRSGVTKEMVLNVIKDYQYAISWLIEFLCKQADLYMSIFQSAMTGEVTLANFKKFKESSKIKEISELSNYQMQKIVEAFGSVSFEYLVYLRSQLSSLNSKDKLCVYRLINLVKLGG